jgi:sulfur-oxidizing protein SoxX
MRTCGFAVLGLMAAAVASSAWAQPVKVEPGKAVSFAPEKGNCLACHGFPGLPDAEQTGNSGPPMIAMQARYPDRKLLRDKIWDATAFHPRSFMPPFGKHGVLSEEEIDQVVDFLYGL